MADEIVIGFIVSVTVFLIGFMFGASSIPNVERAKKDLARAEAKAAFIEAKVAYKRALRGVE